MDDAFVPAKAFPNMYEEERLRFVFLRPDEGGNGEEVRTAEVSRREGLPEIAAGESGVRSGLVPVVGVARGPQGVERGVVLQDRFDAGCP